MCVESQDGVLGGIRRQDIAKVPDVQRVYAGQRLVQHQHRRLADQSLRQSHPLPVALGQVPHQPPCDRLQIQLIQRNLHGICSLGPRHPLHVCRVLQIGLDAKIGREGGAFGQVADLRTSELRVKAAVPPPPTTMSPSFQSMRPLMQRMIVDLPAPFGPRSAVTPLPIWNETFCTAGLVPYSLVRLLTVISGSWAVEVFMIVHPRSVQAALLRQPDHVRARHHHSLSR